VRKAAAQGVVELVVFNLNEEIDDETFLPTEPAMSAQHT
jgi:hypothetical protein